MCFCQSNIVCLLFFIFILITNCFPQHSAIDVLHINKVPPQGIVLDKGWKFISVGDKFTSDNNCKGGEHF
jgi:hypothetical protein